MTIKDEQIWLDYTRAVKRVSKKARKSMPSNTAPDKSAKRKAAAAPPRFIPQPLPAKSLKESLSQGLERKREKSIRQGSLDIEATLDLHGLTQIEAFDALAAFMKRAASSGKRQLLIITAQASCAEILKTG